mmetsp:Transcript_105907/g.165310  ORF Transcript_105907/g.165310 Transcript_105907/m.165310 type:complete len:209 (+) Transcript_105907:1209-1835(+)
MHQESCDAIWFAFCSFASDALAQFAELCHRLSLQLFLLLHDYSADFGFLRSSFCSRLCLMLEKSLDHGFLCSSCQAILCHKFFEISHVHRLQFFCPFDLYLFFFLGKSFLWADFFLFLLFLITILFLILLLLLVLFLFFYNVSLLFCLGPSWLFHYLFDSNNLFVGAFFCLFHCIFCHFRKLGGLDSRADSLALQHHFDTNDLEKLHG